jgi:TRAP-type C4-dicarboxylate transport system substrate-binding protein
VLTEHIITPRMVIANDAFWRGLPTADRTLLETAMSVGQGWQDKELLSQEATLVATLKAGGMTVIEPDLALWRKPVLDTVPARFEARWGKGNFEALGAL